MSSNHIVTRGGAVVAKSHLDRAKSAIEHSIAHHRLRLPTDKPILRVAFDHEPSWQLMALVQAFDHDAYFVFQQALNITDAYYGCFEADFEPSDKSDVGLNYIATKVTKQSDFDDLIEKYRILSVRLFNFPHVTSKELQVNYQQRVSPINPGRHNC
jgi:hypothetical protein